MKLNKTILKQIIKEELDTMQQLEQEQAPPQAGQEQEDPIQKRVQDAMIKWKAGESVIKTIDDPREVVPFIVAVVQHLMSLNPDFSPSELARTIDLLRTKTLPDMKRNIK